MYSDQVVQISFQLDTFIPQYESNGFGQALFQQVDRIILPTLQTYHLQDRQIVYVYVIDRAYGTDPNRKKRGKDYRRGWSTHIAPTLDLPYSQLCQALQAYFSWQGMSREGLSIKVLRDLTVEPQIDYLDGQ